MKFIVFKIFLCSAILYNSSCDKYSGSKNSQSFEPVKEAQEVSHSKVLNQKFSLKNCIGVLLGAGVACLRNYTGKAAYHFNAPLVSIYADTQKLAKIKSRMTDQAIGIRFDKSFLPMIRQDILAQLEKHSQSMKAIDIFMIIQKAPHQLVRKGCQLLVHDWAFFGVGPKEKNYGLPALNSVQRNINLAVFEGSGSVVLPGPKRVFITNEAQPFDVHYHNELWSPDNRRIDCPSNGNISFWSLAVDKDKSAITLHWLVHEDIMKDFVNIFYEGRNEDEEPRELTVKEWLCQAIKIIPGSYLLPSLYSLIPQNSLCP